MTLALISAAAATTVLPCTVGINIPSVFLFAGYLQRYDLGDWGKDRYDSLPVKADACVECGECESRCPLSPPHPRDVEEMCPGYWGLCCPPGASRQIKRLPRAVP